MKSLLLSSLLFLCVLSVSAQLIPTIQSLGPVPANPSSGGPVGVRSVAGNFPWGTCYRVNYTLNQSGPNQFTIDGYYCMGGLTMICSNIDTTWLPQVPGGFYQITYNLYYSGGGIGNPCMAYQPGNGSTTSFTVHCVNATTVNAQFAANPSNLSVSFTDQSTGNVLSRHWDFGDGSTSTLTQPSHLYAAPGTYNVCLIVSDSCGSDTSCQALTVNCATPLVNFGWSANQLAVQFSDSSSNFTGSPLWTFGDGNSSAQANPLHNYALPGTYQACLIYSNACGTDTFCKMVTVSCTGPAAAFIFTQYGDTVNFQSTNYVPGDSCHWDFGDGSTDTAVHPTHIYAQNGNYWVCMIQSNICGADTFCDSVFISLVNTENPVLDKAPLFFPNPVRDRLMANNRLDEMIRLDILDATGRIILQHHLQPGRLSEIGLTQLSPGMYHLQWQNETGSLRGSQQFLRIH